MFEKAKQVMVREYLEDSKPYEFGAILVGGKLVAMDNGAVLNPNEDNIEIVKVLPWINLSDELLGN